MSRLGEMKIVGKEVKLAVSRRKVGTTNGPFFERRRRRNR